MLKGGKYYGKQQKESRKMGSAMPGGWFASNKVFLDENRLKNEMCEIVICIPLGKDYYFSIIPIRKYQIPS